MRNSLYICILLFILAASCRRGNDASHLPLHEHDTLKVVTLFGPTSYFIYRGEEWGLDYENVRRFAEQENLELSISVASNMAELIETLKSGNAHLAAYPVPKIKEYSDEILFCGPEKVSWQVLAQKKGDDKITDVTQLIGKEIYVEKDSRYDFRLRNLNEELGGGINIISVDNDTIDSEDLMQWVEEGKISYTIIDSETALLNRSDYPDIDTSLRLSLEQRASWAVALGADSLAVKINRWENSYQHTDAVNEIYKKYYDRVKQEKPDADLENFIASNYTNGKLQVPYVEIFKKYASTSGFDWELLAAIAFCESRFKNNLVSRFGASGIMQVMPSSARAVGVNDDALQDPDTNVKAAVKIMLSMWKALENKIADPEERLKFMIASYNSGLGHIYDSMNIASNTGLDPEKWNGNVSVGALMKSRPEFYNAPEVKHGYFRGKETLEFVDKVMLVYRYLKDHY